MEVLQQLIILVLGGSTVKETTNTYFDQNISMNSCNTPLHDILGTVAGRYIGQHPAGSFRFRAYCDDSFLPDKDGSYNLDLNQKLPEANVGEFALVAARFYYESEDKRTVLFRCYSQTEVYVNGSLLWVSTPYEENNVNKVTAVDLPCRSGWNTLIIRCRKLTSGFGCKFAPQLSIWCWIPFLTPFAEREGQGGLVYSQPFAGDVIDVTDIDLNGSEANTGLEWYPEQNREMIERPGDLNAVFGHQTGKWACAWTKIRQNRPGMQKVIITGSGTVFFLDGTRIEAGEINLAAGTHDLLVRSCCPGGSSWDFSFSAEYETGVPLELLNPGAAGVKGVYLYLGLFEAEPDLKMPTFYGLFGDGEACYWMAAKHTAIRPYAENPCFGRWNYPLGVTLYGLIQAARTLKRPDIMEYVGRHMNECVALHEYSLWDAKTFGYPEINNQLVVLESLDTCGSFGSAMLEYYKEDMDEKVRMTADRIGSYIYTGQPRQENGAFYRIDEGHHGGHSTMWVDDLYMSIPFLCRYAVITGETKYLDDAARQVLQFKKYLFMREEKVMSHVYDFHVDAATQVPWGRGNGWALFSITELLEYLPVDHPDRKSILTFFTTLCEGYLALQGSRGLWHQVLTMPDSYEEASCTAMFIYGFCRAVRFGWIEGPFGAQLLSAAMKAWDGLKQIALDRFGNVYGICRGSFYSFAGEYYRDTLGWTLNDTHGIGIILLAGIELDQALQVE